MVEYIVTIPHKKDFAFVYGEKKNPLLHRLKNTYPYCEKEAYIANASREDFFFSKQCEIAYPVV